MMLSLILLPAHMMCAGSRVIEVKNSALLEQKINGNPLVVVEFAADNCGHCKSYDKNGNGEFHQFSNETPQVTCVKATVASVDGVSRTFPGYKLNGTPSFRFFKNGQMAPYTSSGGLSKEAIKSNVASLK